jgi:hypothetical protein
MLYQILPFDSLLQLIKDYMNKIAVKNKEFICRRDLVERIQDMWYACADTEKKFNWTETKSKIDFLHGINEGLYEIRKKFVISPKSIEQYKATENIAVVDVKEELEKLDKEWNDELKHAGEIKDSYSVSYFSGKIEAIKRVLEQVEMLKKTRSCP